MKTTRKKASKKPAGWMRQSVRHDYLTPPDLVDIVLKHIGRERFDIDVCSTLKNIPAWRRFTVDDNALVQDWQGVCWMNPPCGPDLQKFCAKMLQEVEKGAEVWALLPSRFPDFYVSQFRGYAKGIAGVLRQASFVYVIPEWSISFGLPDGSKTGQAKTSWWLCHFGKNGAVERYKFRHADPFKGTKYEGVLLCPMR